MLGTKIKFVIATAILAWLFSSGKLDFSLLVKSFENKGNFFLGISLLIVNIIATCVRWKILLEVKSQEKLPFSKVLPVHWIGQFFSTFLPGVVTGDVLKLLYVKDINKNFSKTFLFTSVVVDRIIGLCGLLFLSGIITLSQYDELISLSPKMLPFIQFNSLLGLGALGFLVCLFLPKRIQNPILDIVEKIPFAGKKIRSLSEQVWLFGQNKMAMLKSISVSIAVQFIGITAIWIFTSPFYGKEIPLLLLFGFIPIGLISVAIPISPAGAGVGHLVFDTLFKIVGVQGGSSLFNLYFICIIFTNLLGVIPYIFYGKRHSIDEAKEFDNEKEEAATS